MNTTLAAQKVRLSSWTAAIQEQMESGINVRDWCTQHNVSRSKFYYWKRRIQGACIEQALPDIVQISLSDACPKSSEPFETSCTEFSATDTSTPASIHAVEPPSLPCPESSETFDTPAAVRMQIQDVSFEIGPDTSAELITRIVKAVRNA